MYIQSYCILALIVSVTTGCITTPPPATTIEFTQADQNKDGFVTLAEWLRFGGAESAFLAIDRNRVGYLGELSFREALRLSDQGGRITQRQQEQIDQQLVLQVESRLKLSQQLNSWNIRVQGVQRNITLSGTVRTIQEKNLIEKITYTVEGVGEVYNQISIHQ